MSLDGISMHPLAIELDRAVAGGRIDRINQPSKQSIVMSLRLPGKNVLLHAPAVKINTVDRHPAESRVLFRLGLPGIGIHLQIDVLLAVEAVELPLLATDETLRSVDYMSQRKYDAFILETAVVHEGVDEVIEQAVCRTRRLGQAVSHQRIGHTDRVGLFFLSVDSTWRSRATARRAQNCHSQQYDPRLYGTHAIHII